MPSIGDLLQAKGQQTQIAVAKKRAAMPRVAGDTVWSWMAQRMSELPRRDREIHERLWRRGLLMSGEQVASFASVMDYSARLLETSFQLNKRSCVVLPI